MSSEHVTTLADRFGASEALIQRSADARATAGGTTSEEVLSAWTGGTPAPITSAPPQSAPATPPTPPEAVKAEKAPGETPADSVTTEPAPDPGEQPQPAEAPAPAPATPATRTSGLSPWVVAALLIIPLFGLLYLVVNSNGVACGDGGRLEVAFDGSIVNCDGTAFEGRGGGEAEAAALLAVGREVYTTGARCNSCHGNNGQGGTGPAMSGGAVLETWPSCDDQVEWITLGSNGWSVEVGSNYGAQAKPVEGGMPAFNADLTEEEIRAVAAFERIIFGGASAEETRIACGLREEESVNTGAGESTPEG